MVAILPDIFKQKITLLFTVNSISIQLEGALEE